jgi:hypothetical protein
LEFAALLPGIGRQLHYDFSRLGREAAEEAVQEGIANCLQAFVRLQQQNRAEDAKASSLARFAARQVRSGRTVGSRLNSHDPLSRYAQIKNGLRVNRFESAELSHSIEEALVDRRTSIPQRVALRIDLPSWLGTLSRNLQRIASDLALGFSTGEVAAKYGLTAGRVSQIRRELYKSWHEFHLSHPALS